jgi:hypothetical protein
MEYELEYPPQFSTNYQDSTNAPRKCVARPYLSHQLHLFILDHGRDG